MLWLQSQGDLLINFLVSSNINCEGVLGFLYGFIIFLDLKRSEDTCCSQIGFLR